MAAPNDGQAGRATAQGLNALDTLRNLIASNSNPQLNAQLDAIKADYQAHGDEQRCIQRLKGVKPDNPGWDTLVKNIQRMFGGQGSTAPMPMPVGTAQMQPSAAPPVPQAPTPQQQALFLMLQQRVQAQQAAQQQQLALGSAGGSQPGGGRAATGPPAAKKQKVMEGKGKATRGAGDDDDLEMVAGDEKGRSLVASLLNEEEEAQNLLAGRGPMRQGGPAAEAAAAATAHVPAEFVLAEVATMRKINDVARRAGAKQVDRDVFALVALAAEAHLTTLLQQAARSATQRLDDPFRSLPAMARTYDVRTGLFGLRKADQADAEAEEKRQQAELLKHAGTRARQPEELAIKVQAAKIKEKTAMDSAKAKSQLSAVLYGKKRSLQGPSGAAGAGAPGQGGAAGAAGGGAAPGATGAKFNLKASLKGGGGGGLGGKVAAPKVPGPPRSAPLPLTMGGAVAAGARPASVAAAKPEAMQIDSGAGAGAGAGGTGAVAVARPGPSVVAAASKELKKTVGLTDLLSVMERHPVYAKHPLVQTLYVQHLTAKQGPSSGPGR